MSKKEGIEGNIVLVFMGISKVVGILTEEVIIPSSLTGQNFERKEGIKQLVLRNASVMLEEVSNGGVNIGTVLIGDMVLPPKGVIIAPLSLKSPYSEVYCKSLGITTSKIIIPEMKVPMTVM